jgi:hypothetical protein
MVELLSPGASLDAIMGIGRHGMTSIDMERISLTPSAAARIPVGRSVVVINWGSLQISSDEVIQFVTLLLGFCETKES